jgi:hypothetical protein
MKPLNINPNVRNVLIIVIVAALVVAIPGGGAGARTLIQAVVLIFFGAMAWVATRMYRERRMTLFGLGDGRRAVLYVAVGVATVVLSASSRMLHSGAGTVAWIVLIGACVYAVFAVIWAAREY